MFSAAIVLFGLSFLVFVVAMFKREISLVAALPLGLALQEAAFLCLHYGVP